MRQTLRAKGHEEGADLVFIGGRLKYMYSNEINNKRDKYPILYILGGVGKW
jgi:hypothetical protein